MSYCAEMGEDKKCNTLLAWVTIECVYCNEKIPLRDYHISYRIDINRMQLYCPKCKKNMELESFNLKKIEE